MGRRRQKKEEMGGKADGRKGLAKELLGGKADGGEVGGEVGAVDDDEEEWPHGVGGPFAERFVIGKGEGAGGRVEDEGDGDEFGDGVGDGADYGDDDLGVEVDDGGHAVAAHDGGGAEEAVEGGPVGDQRIRGDGGIVAEKVVVGYGEGDVGRPRARDGEQGSGKQDGNDERNGDSKGIALAPLDELHATDHITFGLYVDLYRAGEPASPEGSLAHGTFTNILYLRDIKHNPWFFSDKYTHFCTFVAAKYITLNNKLV